MAQGRTFLKEGAVSRYVDRYRLTTSGDSIDLYEYCTKELQPSGDETDCDTCAETWSSRTSLYARHAGSIETASHRCKHISSLTTAHSYM